MASQSGAVWAIDLGNNSLKALHLTAESGVVEVIGFDNIQHSKILAGSGVTPAEKDEIIALSLRQFVKQNDLSKDDDIIVSVPSQNSFARFVNLPPVEQKRIPEIIKFEAAQQIPFDIDDVQWDWQLMTETGSPETKVGIFAVKNEVVSSELEYFSREDVQIGYVQMAPMALYNYILYDCPDLSKSDEQGLVVLDIGAENTDLVICTNSTVWQRAIPMGGNAFTRAISETFKLNFEKAEKLKRTAPMSKYARQIFQAMRPVFTDLASEVQRSIGFYSSSNPNTKLMKVIALGGGTKLRGLLKYLAQSLQIPVERPDSFKKLAIRQGISAAKFHENVSDFGVVYGLGLQALGLSRIESNLLPRSVSRSMAWAGKSKYFTAAACLVLVVSLLAFARSNLDRINYEKNKGLRDRVGSIIKTARQASSKLKAEESKASAYEAMIKKEFEPFNHRDVVPRLYQTIISTLPNAENNKDQKELYEAFDNGDVKTARKIPRKERKQIFVTSISVSFTSDVATAQFGETAFLKGRGGKGKKGSQRRMAAREQQLMAQMFGLTDDQTKYRPTTRRPKQQGTKGEEVEAAPGFVVTIAGYSPYKKIGELLDPAGVENDPDKWGVVTRLLHLDDIVDGNSPFGLYKKTDSQHFRLEIEPVDLINAEGMPVGTGIADLRPAAGADSAGTGSAGEQVLIDPMTKEIISRVAELGEDGKPRIDPMTGQVVYKDNDYWFILNVKFIWKDAPKEITQSG